MRAIDITPGDILELKPERQAAYGLDSPYVRVTELRPHSHFKRVWIYSGEAAFFPQDFKRRTHMR